VVPAGAKIPPESLVAGVPAVVKKKLEGKAFEWVDHGGPEYVKLSRHYLQAGIGDPDIHEIAVTVLEAG
jgi:carbonic anhydrase/acetyltransferase-like protein (isoleucine patch superfamily)